MEKYKADLVNFKITKYKVIKETNKKISYVYLHRDKFIEFSENKVSQYHSWHDTFDEAKQYLINYFNTEIDKLNNQIICYKKSISKIELLKEE